VRVIGVIDLRGGHAVHARAGRRDDYSSIGDAVDLARTYVDRHGLSEIYVADLDAIEDANVERPFQGREDGDPKRVALHTICGLATVWLDAAVSSIDRARHARALGAAHVVVGLETLPSFAALHDICEAVDGPTVAFSLDLRDGAPIGIASRDQPHAAAARAARAGAGAIIVLDLSRVGMRSGLDLELIGRVRNAAPGVTLLAGGGVRGPEDLARLAAAGCDGALVATALHDGSLDGWRPPYSASR
jgi:phosphoribosylformimino-5-aminoimidazole carboxamide ribotide isomerase